MTARGLGLALLMLAASAAGPAVADETCASGSGGQYAKGIQVCVSSVLARQGETNYGPDHLTTGETGAWCEGAAGRGIGETITLRADGRRSVPAARGQQRLRKSAQTFARNGRIKAVEITSDSGIKARQTLPNRRDAAHIKLPKPATAWVKLKIVEVYAGGRHTDTCLTYIAPDCEYEDRRGRRLGS